MRINPRIWIVVYLLINLKKIEIEKTKKWKVLEVGIIRGFPDIHITPGVYG